jgi:hypothetical protein
MTWLDVVLISALAAAVAAILVWLGVIPRGVGAAIWAGVTAIAGLFSRIVDSPTRENPPDTKPETEPYETEIDEYDDGDEDLDTSDPGSDVDAIWLDAHRRGARRTEDD